VGGGGRRREREAGGTRKGLTAAVTCSRAAGLEDGGRERIGRGITVLDERRSRRDEDSRRQGRKVAGSRVAATGMKTHMSGKDNKNDVKRGEGEEKIVS